MENNRLRLRTYKSCDATIIEKWIRNKDVFTKWGDHHFDGCPRYKLLKQNELMDYMEWYL